MIELRPALFWDTDPKKIDLQKNAQYVIERIADFGNDEEVRWAFKFYGKPFLGKIITKSRCLRPETKKLWTLLTENQ